MNNNELNLFLTLDAKDDGIGILHVGPAYAEDGLLGVWCHACGDSLGVGEGEELYKFRDFQ